MQLFAGNSLKKVFLFTLKLRQIINYVQTICNPVFPVVNSVYWDWII